MSSASLKHGVPWQCMKPSSFLIKRSKMISSLRIAIERTVSSNFSTYSMIKDAKRFQKMVDRMSRKKKPNYSPVLLTTSTQSAAYDNAGSSKRLANLNKVYMQEISLLLNGGVYKSQLSSLGVQITKVKMAQGLNFLHIYWITLEKDFDEENINKILEKALEELQQEMGSIRFTSKVPLLKFVRDKRLENELHLEEIFQSADFGKDFKPVYESKVITPDFIHKDMKFPEMRQDVLGLDYEKIKRSIESKILRFRAINIEWIDKEEQEKEPVLPEKLIVFTHKDFTRFYRRRITLEIKMKKKLGEKYKDDLECVNEEEEDSSQTDYEEYFRSLQNQCNDDYEDDLEEEQ